MREAARKLIRSTNILRTASDPFWPRTLEEHVRHFLVCYPKMTDQLEFFLTQTDVPQSSATLFNVNLLSFIGWIQCERRRQSTVAQGRKAAGRESPSSV